MEVLISSHGRRGLCFLCRSVSYGTLWRIHKNGIEGETQEH
jgi:hypothetical protein